jgi:hypothetical protein
MKAVGKVNSTTAIAKSRSKAVKLPLVHRGVVILRPAVAPDTPLARIRRAARIAVKQHVHDLAPVE